ncbi:MAG TPA: hypothetical protein DEF45_00070 [Rhodopirellula sp.]|nr:MAG: hypothetical protein CBD74_04350 [Saprospirales bacterium TMED214]HBV61392.1 hypothetical protein [Rhodopirellula sp.]
MMFCLSSDQLLDKTIFRDADDTSGHEAKEYFLLNPKKSLLPKHKQLQSTGIPVKVRNSKNLSTRRFKPRSY